MARCDAEIAELTEAIERSAATLTSLTDSLGGAVDAMAGRVATLGAQKAKAQELMHRESSGVQDDEWGDDDALVGGEALPSLEEQAAQRRREYGVAAAGAAAGEAAGAAAGAAAEAAREREVVEARLEACRRSITELEVKRKVQAGFVEATEARQREWRERVEAAAGAELAHRLPVFPVGDAILEPFWPQGLGSNRGFHSALDAVWAAHVAAEAGLDEALLERHFWYDLMLQGPWNPGAGLLKPAEGWCADPVSRYADGAIVRTKHNYCNPQSKRLFRGEGATPARIRALDLKGAGFL